jgi:CBS domain-containing protein
MLATLGLEVGDVMTPEVFSVTDEATLGDAVDAMAVHRVHAVLVTGAQTGTPLGWVTTRGLLGLVQQDPGTPVTDAITEEARSIDPNATLRAAVYALALPGVGRLLVRSRGGGEPEGVITEYDLTVRAARLSRPEA